MAATEITQWLDNLLTEIEGVRIERRNAKRLRVDLAAEALPALLELLHGRASYVHLSAISCVDWIDDGEFELVYHLWSYESQSLVSACSYGGAIGLGSFLAGRGQLPRGRIIAQRTAR